MADDSNTSSPDTVVEGISRRRRANTLLPDRGTKFGRYLVIDRIGEGGMGAVFSAFDPELDRKVAIKIVQSRTSSEHQMRLIREAQAMARLSHPNVTTVHDVGALDSGRLFIAMELIDGVTLRQWCKKPRSWREIVTMFSGAGTGLAAAHAAGIIHRDFKPENVMVGSDGRPRVMDFGLARAAVEEDASTFESVETERSEAGNVDAPARLTPRALESALTREGVVQGTPRYMAPEQWAGETVDARSDQWNFGVALYEALYGEPPFDTKQDKRTDDERWKLREPKSGRHVPAWLRRAVLRSLQRQPRNRYPSMNAMLRELARDRSRMRRRIAIAGLAVVALAGAAVAIHMARTPSGEVARCDGVSNALAGVWDAQAKHRLEAAFLATKHPRAAATVQTLERSLDTYAKQWVEVGTEACMATRVRGEQSDQVLRLRTACLESRRRDLLALTNVLAHVDASTIDKAVDGVYHLPDFEACSDLTLLTAAVEPPPRAIADRVEALRAQLAEVPASLFTGNATVAEKRSAELRAECEAVGYPPLAAEALGIEALVQLKLVSPGAFEQGLAAVRALVAVGDDRRALDVLLMIFSYSSNAREHVTQSDALLAVADGLVQRLHSPPLLLAQLYLGRSDVHVGAGRLDAALEEVAQGTAIAEKHPEVRYLLRSFVSQQATILTMLGRFDEAIPVTRKALALAEELYGSNSRSAAYEACNLSLALNFVRDYAGALVNGERARAFMAEFKATPQATVYVVATGNVALALRGLGRLDEAETIATEAVDVASASLGPGHPRVAEALDGLGKIQLDAGNATGALATFRRGLAILDATTDVGDFLVPQLTDVGIAELALGHPDRAVPPLERAIAIAGELKLHDDALATTRFGLARALRTTHSTPERVRALAEQARASFERSHDPQLVVVNDFLAKQ